MSLQSAAVLLPIVCAALFGVMGFVGGIYMANRAHKNAKELALELATRQRLVDALEEGMALFQGPLNNFDLIIDYWELVMSDTSEGAKTWTQCRTLVSELRQQAKDVEGWHARNIHWVAAHAMAALPNYHTAAQALSDVSVHLADNKKEESLLKAAKDGRNSIAKVTDVFLQKVLDPRTTTESIATLRASIDSVAPRRLPRLAS